jgi:hypothetical protein
VNKHTTSTYSTLLRNKLGKLAIKLQQRSHPTGVNTDLVTLEQVVGEAVKLLGKFYKNLSEPNFEPVEAIPNTPPTATDYNDNFESIKEDLEVIFGEFENMEGVTMGSFNYMVSRLNRLHRKLKSASSLLGDYILFSDLATKDAIFFSDSFNNLNRIEVNSPLLNTDQCEISQVEGIVTLPAEKKSQTSLNISETPVINANSNGTIGNNQETGAQYNGDISVILDNNADTWFEYERIVSADDGEALVLDFTINLGSEEIINFVRVSPNNFGTRKPVQILNIDTSLNGKDFVSIKDDIPIAGFVAQDEENVFSLAPSTSKFAGQGLYTFTPRKARYVHLTLEQATSYIISTSNGERFRYAIGVRDVDIQAVPYKKKGEVVSTAYETNEEIRKVVLLSSQNPDSATTSKLASISHYVSPDNGISWHQIRPKVSVGKANTTQIVPELIDFNGVAVDTINTASPVTSLRYKAILERDPEAFDDASSELAQTIEDVTELHTLPTTTPYAIVLQETPIEGTLKVVDPNFGSRGIEDDLYQITVGTGDKLVIKLPFPLKHDNYKYPYVVSYIESGIPLEPDDPQLIYIDGELWQNMLSPDSGPDDKHYYLNFEDQELEFGDGVTGRAVPQGATITMRLGEERLYPDTGPSHIATLDYTTTNNQKECELALIHPMAEKTVVLPPGSTRNVLDEDIMSHNAYPITFSDTTVFNSRVLHPNLVTSAGDYYLNTNTGLLLSYTPTSTVTKTTISYYYRKREIIHEDNWSFSDQGAVFNTISISDDVYQTFSTETTPETIPAGVKYFSLRNWAIVPGSLSVTTPSGVIASGVYGIEVAYKDGYTEFSDVIETREKISAIEGISGATNITKAFTLEITADTDYEVTFSNPEIFASGVVGAPATVGEYQIDRANRQYTVRVDRSITSPGYVSYYYVNPQATTGGLYSVNYPTGEIFLNTSTGAADTIFYEYTDYRLKYPVAREIPSSNWTLDRKSNRITIEDREILRSMKVPQVAGNQESSKYYRLSYKYVATPRADIEELEPYFSPVLKDYALKVITASNLI